MDNIYILKEIARWDSKVWKLFSLLNKEMNKYFNIRNKEYELNFREIDVDNLGTYYYLDGIRHRSDGPAVIWNDGGEVWWFNGKLHRLDGPAVIKVNDFNEWWVNGKLHRLDGPAVEYTGGMEGYGQWYIDGIEGKRVFPSDRKK